LILVLGNHTDIYLRKKKALEGLNLPIWWEGLTPSNFGNFTIPLYIRTINLYIKNDGTTPNRDSVNLIHPNGNKDLHHTF
jgi:hypothetical protein